MKKLLYIFAILLASITVNAQYTNVGNGLQRQIIGTDTTYRFSLAPGFMYPATRYWVSQQLTGLTTDSTVFRTVANSLSLAQLQTKFNLYSRLSGNNNFTGTNQYASASVFNGSSVFNAGSTFIDDNLKIKPSGSSFSLSLKNLALTANRIIQFPDLSGTVALTSDLTNYASLSGNNTYTGSNLYKNFIRVENAAGTNYTVIDPSSSTDGFINTASPNGAAYIAPGVLRINKTGEGQNSILPATAIGNFTNRLPAASGTIALTSDLNSYELLSNKSTSTALGTSNTLYPTQNAVKTYVDNSIAAVPIPTLQQVTTSGNSTTTGAIFNGDVGIGTVSPSAKLDVTGSSIFRANTNAYIKLNNIDANNPLMSFTDLSNGEQTGNIKAYEFNFITNSLKRLFVSNSGNVGIGTTTPATALDVSGSARASANDGNANTLMRNTDGVHKTGTESIAGAKTFTDNMTITNVDVNGVANLYQRPYIVTSRPDIQFSATGDGTDGNNWNVGSVASQTFAIQTVNDAGASPKTAMAITRSGNNVSKVYFPQTAPVGIGTTNPITQFNVNGSTGGVTQVGYFQGLDNSGIALGGGFSGGEIQAVQSDLSTPKTLLLNGTSGGNVTIGVNTSVTNIPGNLTVAKAPTNPTDVVRLKELGTGATTVNNITGSTYSITDGGLYRFTGTTSTFTLPTITGNVGKTIFILNRGSGAITLNSNSGSSDIYNAGSLLSTTTVNPTGTSKLINDGVNWVFY